MFAVLPVMRQLHEMLWYLTEAATLPAAAAAGRRDRRRAPRTERARRRHAGGADRASTSAPTAREVGELLARVSDARPRAGRPDHRGADLDGPRPAPRADLRDASLRGAYLIGADLRGVDLGTADLLGADLRGADVRGADLSRVPVPHPAAGDARPGATCRQGSLSPCAAPAHWAARR